MVIDIKNIYIKNKQQETHIKHTYIHMSHRKNIRMDVDGKQNI
jgi:hypothetical protein